MPRRRAVARVRRAATPVRRPALSKSRPSTSSAPGGCSRRGVRRSGATARSARASAAKECSRLLRAPCSHQISRSECSCASAWSMARTGVAPMPALISSTGAPVSVEDEGAARCCDLELVADGEAGVQVAAGGAVVLALDGDPVVAGIGRPGEGVVAEHRPLLARRAGSAA